jgi:hypothetical protein
MDPEALTRARRSSWAHLQKIQTPIVEIHDGATPRLSDHSAPRCDNMGARLHLRTDKERFR